VQVSLPKFRAESQFSLRQALTAMGMPIAFTGSADFSGIDPKRGLAISAVVHKAFVDVSEQGTEAAAATGVTMRTLAMRMPEPAVVFRADHPFLFLIRDTRTGVVLFIGRLMTPR
jgi:serpin B